MDLVRACPDHILGDQDHFLGDLGKPALNPIIYYLGDWDQKYDLYVFLMKALF